MTSPHSTEAIAGLLKERGVRRLAYFHTDHFEPWRNVPGRPADIALGVGDVEAYARQSAELDFARRATLFVKSNVNFAVDDARDLHRADPSDRLGFVPHGEAERALNRAILAPVVGENHELQVHIHHENFIWNASQRDVTTRDYLATDLGKEFGPARLELAVRLNLMLLREDAGLALDRWFFIHGHWALNASDPDECTVVREIELLMRNGCVGDFTQPAGRTHVDSRIDRPYLAVPVAEAKGYDTAAAQPIDAAGNRAQANGRFFLWATALAHTSASIDIYAKAVARRAENPYAFGLAQAGSGVVVGDTLYVKTHGHSMAPFYWEGSTPFPHAHPAIQAELLTLFEAASVAGTRVDFVTASEVYDEILDGPRGEAGNLRAGHDAHSMEDQGITVVHRTADGALADAPPLPFRTPRIAPPCHASPPSDDGEPRPALPDITLIETAVAKSRDAGEPAAPPSGIEGQVAHINRVASRLATELIDARDAERLGVTGYYQTRAREGAVLQAAEVRVAAEFAARHEPGTLVWEIGCGLGVLTTLLASLGFQAHGLDRKPGRIEVAEAIARAVADDGLEGAGAAVFAAGVFPGALKGRTGLAGGVALVTNLLGSAELPAQQRFIGGLRRFDEVWIDLQRFFTRRTSPAEQDELVAMFRAAGFPAPEPIFAMASDGNYVRFGRAALPLFGKEAFAIRVDRFRSKR